MAKGILVGTIVTLIFVVIVLSIVVLFYRRDLIDCEQNESPYCPQFTCPTPVQGQGNGPGKPAQRTTSDGKTQYSR